ncbi:HEPN domain-containing protein [Roseobacter fucihabitans]|uniref:HEPN domain-containing protein n=1 Tax=Roseobacter fucihabitans TaxID=1537242 RepID=UPI001CA37BF0|nr:HEPN domain-containing protein [Roseobacter litoralis]
MKRIPFPSPVFHLKKTDEPALKSIAHSLFERQHPEAYLASLRLFRALKRTQLDDSILDLVIALEALFNGNNEMAIAHKISQRLTRLLEQPKKTRRNTTKIIKQAYGLRSSLVHGTKRQIDFIEAALEKNPRDRKKLIYHTEISTLRDHLIDLVSAALFARYTTHRNTATADLITSLDDRAI